MKKEIKVYTKTFDVYYKENISEIRFHGMAMNKTFSGIYKLMLGEKFYIGRSLDIRSRAKQHRQELNQLRTGEIRQGHYLTKVINHFRSSGIKILDVHLLALCDQSNSIEKEQEWLSKYENDTNCLNIGFTSKLSSYEMKLLNFVPIEITETFILNSQSEHNLYLKFKSELSYTKSENEKRKPLCHVRQ